MSSTIIVDSPNVTYLPDRIVSTISYARSKVEKVEDKLFIKPVSNEVTFETSTIVPKLGVMLVGWGGNNGSTLTASILAHKHNIEWQTKHGIKRPDYFGSVTQSSTLRVGNDGMREIFAPFKNFVPLVNPNEIVFDGWDISGQSLSDSMKRAAVLDYALQTQLEPFMQKLVPRPGIFSPDFVAPNQNERADHILSTEQYSKSELLDIIRNDIRDFKQKSLVEKVIVLWTASTERFSQIESGLNDTKENLLNSVKENKFEIAPSTLYAIASVMEGVSFINGSPQNTFVPGLIDLASDRGVFLAGDDFKSGQTKLKSVLVEFLVGTGIKPESIASYNHLGNNDGYNLSNTMQFRSKEITKTNVVDDMVKSNQILYENNKGPDHCVVIKYMPYVGDSKRAIDEYICSIFMGGQQTFVIHNTCEDSLLAAPIMLDLVILMELIERVTIKVKGISCEESKKMHTVASLLSYFCKAPLVPEGTPLVNALFRQKQCVENFIRSLVGLMPEHNLLLEHKTGFTWEPCEECYCTD